MHAVPLESFESMIASLAILIMVGFFGFARLLSLTDGPGLETSAAAFLAPSSCFPGFGLAAPLSLVDCLVCLGLGTPLLSSLAGFVLAAPLSLVVFLDGFGLGLSLLS